MNAFTDFSNDYPAAMIKDAAPKYPNRIRKIRKGAGLTLKGLAALADMSVSYLSDLERGNRRLNVDLMRSISAALNVAPEDLVQAATGDEALDDHIATIQALPIPQRQMVYNFTTLLAKAAS